MTCSRFPEHAEISTVRHINALAEIIIGLFKTETIYQTSPQRGLETVEFATLEWVDWFNRRRLTQPIGDVPPAEKEAAYYGQYTAAGRAA